MQTIEVSDEQYAYIEQLRSALQNQAVGRYGTCLDRDAIQFLIDNLDDDLDLEETFTAEIPDGNELEFSEASVPDAAAEPGEATEADDESSSSGGTPTPTAEDADDDEMLDEMMNLLETYDDKWTESPSGDYRYRVDLPDGGTEDVQTKDDVRAILFREYR